MTEEKKKIRDLSSLSDQELEDRLTNLSIRAEKDRAEYLNYSIDLKINKEIWDSFLETCENFGLDNQTVIRIFINRFIEDPDVQLMYDSIKRGEF
ncbi:MAG: hypothetical protein ACOCRZ_05210 [Halothermotrichaceae bacterium]